MSETMTDAVKRWTAKRKSALVIEIIQGKTTEVVLDFRPVCSLVKMDQGFI